MNRNQKLFRILSVITALFFFLLMVAISVPQSNTSAATAMSIEGCRRNPTHPSCPPPSETKTPLPLKTAVFVKPEEGRVKVCPVWPYLQEVWDEKSHSWEILYYEIDPVGWPVFVSNLTFAAAASFRNPTISRDNCAFSAQVQEPGGEWTIRVYDFGLNRIDRFGHLVGYEPEFVLVQEDWIYFRGKDGYLYKGNYLTGKVEKTEYKGSYPHSVPLDAQSYKLAFTTPGGTLAVLYSNGVYYSSDEYCERVEWKPSGGDLVCRSGKLQLRWLSAVEAFNDIFRGVGAVAISPNDSGVAIFTGSGQFVAYNYAWFVSLIPFGDKLGFGSDIGGNFIYATK
jgi:hypothetical protein